MTRPLTFDFPMMSDLAERAPCHIPMDELLLEAEEVLDYQRIAGQRAADQHRPGGDDAAHHLAVWKLIVEHCWLADADDATVATAQWSRRRDAVRAAPIAWADKVREIRRVLAIRRNAARRQIDTQRLDEATARSRLEALDGLHWFFFVQAYPLDIGPDWDGVSAEDARTICRAHDALCDEWLERAAPAGDRAALAWLAGQPFAHRFHADERSPLLARLAELRPDLTEPRQQEAA